MRICAYIVLCALFPGFAFAEATLYLSPPRATYTLGEVFDVYVLADTGGTPIHAAEAEMMFDPSALSVDSISTENSILTTFATEPTYSNGTGNIAFSGWTQVPYVGTDGLLLSIRFKALRTHTSRASLVAGAILAVKQNSNIITSMKSGLYSVTPQQESPVAASTTEVRQVSALSTSLLDIEPPYLEPIPSISAGERFKLYGTTIPNLRVWVRVVGPSMDGETAIWSDEFGSFSYTSGEIARDGIYRISARAETVSGNQSEWSERIILEVRPRGVWGYATAATGFLQATFPFVLLIIIGGLVVGYGVHRRSLINRHSLR